MTHFQRSRSRSFHQTRYGVTVDLGAVFMIAYNRGRYARLVDYARASMFVAKNR